MKMRSYYLGELTWPDVKEFLAVHDVAIDTLVVADFEENFLDRIKKLMDMNKFRIPIEPVDYTLKEFKEVKKRKNAFIIEVVEKGKVMYES